jgi:heat-inducible transcriptional repressor
MKPLARKKPAKDEREKTILFGLIDLYLKEGKPVGSDTLREKGFDSFSSATIRNYFMKLEDEGFLKQLHSSGGRIPTTQALRLFAHHHLLSPEFSQERAKQIQERFKKETREVTSYLQKATEEISEITGCAAFLSAPRFDQDFILEVKLVLIDHSRFLAVLITDFGQIKTEVLYAEKKVSPVLLKRIETYFNWRITGLEKPSLNREEEVLADNLYKELMLRHIVGYTHFSSEDIFQAGFSKLLSHADFNHAAALAAGLSLFENKTMLKTLLSDVGREGKMRCWIGEDLAPFMKEAASCCVIAIPYKINQTICGSLGILGPTRLPFRELFGTLEMIASMLSESLTQSVYKFKLSFRNPESPLLTKHHALLLENQKETR